MAKFDRKKEREILAELFDTISFDHESEGIPPLKPEEDDEDDSVVEVKSLEVKRKKRGLPKTQKCEYCPSRATRRFLWAEGMAYIPVCDNARCEKKVRHQIEVVNEDEVVGVRPIPDVKAIKRAFILSYKARGRGWITHPEETRRLHAYWTRGEGLAKWKNKPHPWRTLRRHLAKYVPAHMLNEVTTRWFHDVFGYYPGSDLHRVRKGKPPRGRRIGPG